MVIVGGVIPSSRFIVFIRCGRAVAIFGPEQKISDAAITILEILNVPN